MSDDHETPETVDVRYRIENSPNKQGVTVDIALEELPDDAVVSGTVAEHIHEAFGIDVADYGVTVSWELDEQQMGSAMPAFDPQPSD